MLGNGAIVVLLWRSMHTRPEASKTYTAVYIVYDVTAVVMLMTATLGYLGIGVKSGPWSYIYNHNSETDVWWPIAASTVLTTM
jgi:ABC-type dipeptide/oligopeptide/nickel transport system permease subunit